MCGKTQDHGMVSGDGYCNFDSKLIFDDHSSLSHCNASSLDLNTSITVNILHARKHRYGDTYPICDTGIL
jgi:hypothetical protein